MDQASQRLLEDGLWMATSERHSFTWLNRHNRKRLKIEGYRTVSDKHGRVFRYMEGFYNSGIKHYFFVCRNE